MIYNINEYKIEKQKHSYCIKNKEGKIISKISYYDYNIKDFDWILVADVETDPKYRRQGLAKMLITELYKDIKSTKKGLYLFVKPDNIGAVALYKNLQFKEVKHYKLKDSDYIIMAKGDTSKFYQFDKVDFS